MAEVEETLLVGLERADVEEQSMHEVVETMARGAEITAETKGNDMIFTAEESDFTETHFGYTRQAPSFHADCSMENKQQSESSFIELRLHLSWIK